MSKCAAAAADDVAPRRGANANADVKRTLFAGAFANVTECCVMHPLDSVKTRLQLGHGRTGGLSAVLGAMYKHGGAREVFRGVLPAVAMQAPRGMVKFAMNSTILGKLTSNDKTVSVPSAAVAGFCAGATESLLITPFELVKVRVQAEQNLSRYANSHDALRKIVQSEGPLSLWNGLQATLIRNGSWNAVYFAMIHIQRSYWERPGSMFSSFVFGTVAGVCGSCFSNPVDVAKSRIQANPKSREMLFKMMYDIGTNEGVGALYKGFLAKILRLGPGGGLLLVAFDSGCVLYDKAFV